MAGTRRAGRRASAHHCLLDVMEVLINCPDAERRQAGRPVPACRPAQMREPQPQRQSASHHTAHHQALGAAGAWQDARTRRQQRQQQTGGGGASRPCSQQQQSSTPIGVTLQSLGCVLNAKAQPAGRCAAGSRPGGHQHVRGTKCAVCRPRQNGPQPWPSSRQRLSA